MLRLLTGVCLAVVTLAVSQASAKSVEEFYKRKGLTLIVGNGPGGGFDVVSRLLARHLSDYVPGHPAIIVQNMPGAGSLLAANYLYSIAPKDGTTFGLTSATCRCSASSAKIPMSGSIRAIHLARLVVELCQRRLCLDRPQGRAGAVDRGCAPRRRPAAILGGTAEGATSADVPRILRDTLGLNIRLVLAIATQRDLSRHGDAANSMAAWSSCRRSAPPDPLGSSLTAITTCLSNTAGSHAIRISRMCRPRANSRNESARALIEFTETPMLTMAWPFVAPPGVPEDRAQALRQAFAAAHRDPEYLAEAARAGVDVNPVIAEDIARSIDQLSRAPPECSTTSGDCCRSVKAAVDCSHCNQLKMRGHPRRRCIATCASPYR